MNNQREVDQERPPRPEPRQKPVPLTREERQEIEKYRRQLEGEAGSWGDWGQFLRSAMLLALAAAGIETLARVAQWVSVQTVDVLCPCGQTFRLALPAQPTGVVQTVCPYCNRNLVVPLVRPR